MSPEIITLDRVESTNNYLREHGAPMKSGTVVCAVSQTAGRGQRGNSWESAPGCNVTMSMLYRPLNILPAQQFGISTAVALAVADTVIALAPEVADRVCVKWPNDIYVGDSKVAGILIEHVISSSMNISRTIIGLGLNVNQTRFVSDAPNPVSLSMLTGRHYDVTGIVETLAENILARLDDEERCPGTLLEQFNHRLWRREGVYRWVDADGSEFCASIDRVDSDGRLWLRDTTETVRPYLFKQVHPVIFY